MNSFPRDIPLLIAFAGLPASGKSSAAKSLKEHLVKEGSDPELIELIDSDELRKSLAKVPITDSLPSSHYTSEAKNKVYEELLQKADVCLQQGKTVIVSATFSNKLWAEKLSQIANKNKAVFFPFILAVPVDECIRRAQKRQIGSLCASDADADIVMSMAKTVKFPDDWIKINAMHSTPNEIAQFIIEYLGKVIIKKNKQLLTKRFPAEKFDV